MELSATDKAILNAMHEGILIIDTEGVIVFGNDSYRRFLNREGGGEDIGEIAGYYLRDLRPGARLPEVLQTRRPILQTPRQEEKDVYFVNMYPIFDADGETLLGGVSVVTFMEEASALQELVRSVQQRSRQMLRSLSRAETSFEGVIARGEKSRACKELAMRVAGSEAAILLTGENGVGKRVYAQAIHNASPRRGGVFVSINCATFHPDALESELFGSVDRSSGGGKAGLFEAAEGGTLLLDEVGELRPELQSKLLRTLEERRIRPVGAAREVPVDVRLLAVSSADLERAVREGRFRADLYYHLSTFHVHIPPLRERMEDLPFLTRLILGELSTGRPQRLAISADAMRRLKLHDWHGNVRELRNVLEFSAYLCADGVIQGEDLPANIGAQETRVTATLAQRVRACERSEIRRTLQYYGDDLKGKKAAAEELGISLATLYNKLKEDA